MRYDLRKRTEQVLEGTGLPWAIEIGAKHWKVRLNGQLVGILPRGLNSSSNDAQKSLEAKIRRVAKGMAS